MKKIDTSLRISGIIYKYLHGQITAEEQEMLECWLKNDRNMEFFMQVKNSDRIYNGLSDMQSVDTEVRFQELQSRIKGKFRYRIGKMLGMIAAVLILGLGVSWFWNNSLIKKEVIPPIVQQYAGANAGRTILWTTGGEVVILPDTLQTVNSEDVSINRTLENPVGPSPLESVLKYNTLETSERGKIELTLCDNTRVWLNAGSCLKYPDKFTGNLRNVYLSGEAYFEVSRNAEQPFIVHTGNGQVQVLGTQFNVNTRVDGESVATLVEGCIKVRGVSNDSVIIYPDQQVCWQSQGNMRVISVDSRYYTAWRKNLFAFQDETLYRIISVLAEWYGFTFDFESIDLSNMRYTTMLEKSQNIENVLEILQRTGDFHFVKNQEGNIKITN